MPRTDPQQVRAILAGEYDSVNTPSINVFIATATAIVDVIATPQVDEFGQMTAALLTQVECWLAAHFYQCSDPPYKSRNTAQASGQFGTKLDTMSFTSTRYGQTACSLDLTGYLARRAKEVEEGARRRVQVFVPQDDCYPYNSTPSDPYQPE